MNVVGTDRTDTASLNIELGISPALAGATAYKPLPTEPMTGFASSANEPRPAPDTSPPDSPYPPLPTEPDTRDGNPPATK